MQTLSALKPSNLASHESAMYAKAKQRISYESFNMPWNQAKLLASKIYMYQDATLHLHEVPALKPSNKVLSALKQSNLHLMKVLSRLMDAILCPFQYISITSGGWADYNERLCAVEPHIWLRRFPLKWDSNVGPLDQKASA